MGMNCSQYFVVEYNGDIYPCDFFVERTWKLGNIATTTWQAAQDLSIYRRFGRQKRKWAPACSSCQWQQLCAGDCLKHRMYAGGDSRTLSWLCSGWKQFFAHTSTGFQELARGIHSTIDK